MEDLARTTSGLYVPAHQLEHVDKGAKADLENHFSGMAKLEHHFPQLVQFAARVASAVERMTGEKGLRPEAVMFDAPRWHPSGKVYVRIGFDPEAKRSTDTDKAAKNFKHLREINDRIPQVVDLVMAIATYLVPVINARKLHASAIKVGRPIFGPERDHFIFDMGMPRPEVDLN